MSKCPNCQCEVLAMETGNTYREGSCCDLHQRGTNKFTVVIQRPQTESIYLGHVVASDASEATRQAQKDVCVCDGLTPQDHSDDYLVLAVFAGHHNDLKED